VQRRSGSTRRSRHARRTSPSPDRGRAAPLRGARGGAPREPRACARGYTPAPLRGAHTARPRTRSVRPRRAFRTTRDTGRASAARIAHDAGHGACVRGAHSVRRGTPGVRPRRASRTTPDTGRRSAARRRRDRGPTAAERRRSIAPGASPGYRGHKGSRAPRRGAAARRTRTNAPSACAPPGRACWCATGTPGLRPGLHPGAAPRRASRTTLDTGRASAARNPHDPGHGASVRGAQAARPWTRGVGPRAQPARPWTRGVRPPRATRTTLDTGRASAARDGATAARPPRSGGGA